MLLHLKNSLYSYSFLFFIMKCFKTKFDNIIFWEVKADLTIVGIERCPLLQGCLFHVSPLYTSNQTPAVLKYRIYNNLELEQPRNLPVPFMWGHTLPIPLEACLNMFSYIYFYSFFKFIVIKNTVNTKSIWRLIMLAYPLFHLLALLFLGDGRNEAEQMRYWWMLSFKKD